MEKTLLGRGVLTIDSLNIVKVQKSIDINNLNLIDYSKFFNQKNFVAHISLRDKIMLLKRIDEFISKLELEHSVFKFPRTNTFK